nr:hypothetical protein BaRGS_010101 [Batillaria attramentaria]
MVGVDSVSRLNMIRHLQRTRYFLLERMQAIDLVNYNKIGLNTFPNMLAMMTGRPRSNYSQPVLKKRPMDMLNTSFLWDEAAQLGYRTLFAEDYPQISIFNFAANGFKNPPTHYYYRPFELAKTKNKKLFGDGRNCYGTQPNDELILDYNLAFQRLFWDKPHFGLTFLTRSTHGTTNGASQV